MFLTFCFAVKTLKTWLEYH